MSPEVEIAALKVQVVNLQDDVRDLTKKVDALLEAVHQARGGWLLLLPLGAIVGAVVSWLLPWFHK